LQVIGGEAGEAGVEPEEGDCAGELGLRLQGQANEPESPLQVTFPLGSLHIVEPRTLHTVGLTRNGQQPYRSGIALKERYVTFLSADKVIGIVPLRLFPVKSRSRSPVSCP